MDEIDVYSIEIIELNHSADLWAEKIQPAHFETYILPQDGAKIPDITDVLPSRIRVNRHSPAMGSRGVRDTRCRADQLAVCAYGIV